MTESLRVFPAHAGADPALAATFEFTAPGGETTVGDVSRGRNGLVISRLEVRPAAGSTGVTAGLLRRIPVGAILATANVQTVGQNRALPSTQAAASERPQRRSGRAPLAQELLRDVAVAYVEENAPGKPTGAMKRLAERFDRPEETVRSWVTRARRDGWLGPSVRGRAGAEPGFRLRAESGAR